MPGNEFEKKVQQKMDELNFAPSDAVWQQVEKQINERKKRRLPLFWLILPVVLLGGAAWLFAVNSNVEKSAVRKRSVEQAVAAKGTGHTESEKNGTGPAGNSASVKQLAEDESPAAIATRDKLTTAPIHPATTVNDDKENIISKLKIDTGSVAMPATASKAGRAHNKGAYGIAAAAVEKGHSSIGKSAGTIFIAKNKARLPGQLSVTEKPIISGKKIAATADITAKEEDTIDNTVADNNATLPSTTQLKVVPQDTIVAIRSVAAFTDSSKHTDTVSSTQQLAQKKPATQKRKNIQWGISAGLGGSNISQGVSGIVSNVFSSSSAYSVFADRNNTQITPGGTINNGQNSFTRPGALKTGMSYALSVFAVKPLGRHFQLIAGLGYSYYSMGLEVGSKIDSNKAILQFSNGNSTAYTNHFHFIELPVIVQKQLGKSSRFSFNGGMALSLLAGSNALQYSPANNNYFKDNGNINKVQLGLLAGFSYRLFQKSVSVETGPQLSYGLSNVFKKETYGSMHLFFAGINARVYFNRNQR